jgi:hypothetical protein
MSAIPSLNSIYFVSALTMLSTNAFAQEPLIAESEFPISRKAVCLHNNKPVATNDEFRLCEEFIKNRKDNFTDGEKKAAIHAVCYVRHKVSHVSHAEKCKADLGVFYKVATQSDAAAPPESSALKSCATGAAVGIGTKILIHGVALALDFAGCAGACTATAATWTLPAAGAIAVGCASAVAADALEGTTRPVQTPRSPK